MGRGEVAVRARDGGGGWLERDTADDWEGRRHYRLGQSAFDPSPMELQGATTAVLSPDAGDLPLLRLLGSTRSTIEVGVYTFQSERIASVLGAAAERGVHVRVLLDGSPVGGVEDDEHRVVGGLLAAGVEVRWLAGAPEVVKRYRYLHAKYAIVDGRVAWIGSGNFGNPGFPPHREGNRGWAVIVGAPASSVLPRNLFQTDLCARRTPSVPGPVTMMKAFSSPPPLVPWSAPPASGARAARIVLA